MTAITRTLGAAHPSNQRTAFIPFRMTHMLRAQKTKKQMMSPCGTFDQAGKRLVRSVLRASPPRYVWMPNHPHATRARRMAGTLAPKTPNDDRHKTGNGIPYF